MTELPKDYIDELIELGASFIYVTKEDGTALLKYDIMENGKVVESNPRGPWEFGGDMS